MSKIFNDYMVGIERESAIEEAYFNNMFSRLNTMYEMVSMQHKQMISDAEYKVFSESGTYDDLSFFLEEAANETGEQKRNILQKIADAISALISKIVNGIKGLFGKTNPEQEVEVDSNVIQVSDQILAKANDFTSACSTNNVIKALAAVGSILGAGFVLKKTGVTQKVKAKVVESKCKSLQTIVENIDNLVSKTKSFLHTPEAKNNEDKSKEDMNIIQKFLSTVSSIISDFKSALFGNKNENNVTPTKSNKDQKQEAPVNPKKERTNGININPNDPHATEKIAGQINGISLINNGEWKVDKNNGNVIHVDKNGVEEDVPDNKIPAKIKALSNRAKGKAAMAQRESDNRSKLESGLKPNKNGLPITVDPRTGKMYNTTGAHPIEVKPTELLSLVPNTKQREKILNQQKKIKDRLANKGIINKVKNTFSGNVHESADIEEMFDILKESGLNVTLEDVIDTDDYDIAMIESEGFMVESTDDFFIISEIVYPENYVESTSESIFGYDLDDEKVMWESAQLENDLKELSEIFADI